MRRPKVFGILTVRRELGRYHDAQRRTLVKATSVAKAAAYLGAAGQRMSARELSRYGGVTGNMDDLAAMADKPEGTVMVRYEDHRDFPFKGYAVIAQPPSASPAAE